MTASAKVAAGARSVSATIAHGLVALTHNGFALVGLLVAFAALTLFSRDDLRNSGEEHLRHWLQARQTAKADEPLDVLANGEATAIAVISQPNGSLWVEGLSRELASLEIRRSSSCPNGRPAYLGSAPTSLSQRVSRRVRSADDPYLAKS